MFGGLLFYGVPGLYTLSEGACGRRGNSSVLWPQGLGGFKTGILLGFRVYRSELLLGPEA